MKEFNEFAAEAAQMENKGQVKEAATARAGWCVLRKRAEPRVVQGSG